MIMLIINDRLFIALFTILRIHLKLLRFVISEALMGFKLVKQNRRRLKSEL